MKVEAKIANLSNSCLSRLYRTGSLLDCSGVLCDNCPFLVKANGDEKCVIALLYVEVYKRREEGQNV